MPTRGALLADSDDAPLSLCDEHVFDVGAASLFLTTGSGSSRKDAIRRDWGSSPKSQSQALFELQRADARKLVAQAQHTLELEELAAEDVPALPNRFMVTA